MKILVIDEEIPYPPNSGKRLRTYNLFRHLARRHTITWVCRSLDGIAFDRRGLEELGIRCEVIDDPVPRKEGLGFYAALMANLGSRYPYVVVRHRSKPMAKRITQLLSAGETDLVHCEWTPYAVNLGSGIARLPSVLSAHNVESSVWEKSYRVERNPFRKAYFLLQWRKMENFERAHCPRFRRVVAVSQEDKKLFSKWVPASNIDVVANGVDTDYFRPAPVEKEEAASVVFVGSLDWRPNIDALGWFLNSVWPKVRARLPEARFHAVGRNPSRELRTLLSADSSLRLHADVPDVRPHVAGACVCVVPLRIGGGSRLKILEAFAMAKAVVSTAVGAEGLNVVSGEHLLIADSPDDFASAVTALVRDPVRRARLGTNARALVERQYRWETLADFMEGAWKRAAGTSPAAWE